MIEDKMRCSSAHEPATRAQVSTEEHVWCHTIMSDRDNVFTYLLAVYIDWLTVQILIDDVPKVRLASYDKADTDEITEDRRDTAASTNLSNTATLTPCNNESHSINLDLKAISEEGGGTEQQLPALGVEEDETQRVYEILQPVATRNSTAKLTLRSDQPTSYYTFPASQCSPDLTALESRVGIVGENVGSGGGIPLEVGLLKNSSPSVTTSFSATHQPTGFNSSLPNDGMPPRALLRKVCDKRSADESDERAFAQSRLAFRQRLLNADEGVCDKRSADESDERAFAQSRLAFRQRLLNADEGVCFILRTLSLFFLAV
ncbi:unnamed protein product [Toxocara canis]|uniref:Uncharacterized protein n=1 Tax=Toxocara canis TaxID=6265 RepID=A0A183VE63_TOXCA|nr:unnamed protein product [Toxocara canis]